MQFNGEFERHSLKIRQQVMLVVVSVTLLTAFLTVSLHYAFSRDLALESAEERYQLTATATRNYLANMDLSAVETVQVVANFPALIKDRGKGDVWINDGTKELFAEVLRTNPVFYALYIGFDDGDLFELVNLNSSEVVRRQLGATPADRWVVIAVEGEGDKRQRTFSYYDEDFKLNFSRSERSDYDVRERLWYTIAEAQNVQKTPPYLFQHLQAPGQSFVKKLPGGNHVLALDITFSTLSSHLRAQSLSASGELYLYQSDGTLLASNLTDNGFRSLPVVAPLELSEKERRYIDSLGVVRVSNEMDWPPVDFAVAGEPSGYSVDVVRVLAHMLGLRIEFVNGYRWSELAYMFDNGELEILQPVAPVDEVTSQLSQSLIELPFALVTREGEGDITSMAMMDGKTLVMLEGWSIIPFLQQRFPDIHFIQADSTRAALEAVASGTADATLDTELVLRQTQSQFYMNGLKMNPDVPELREIPQTLHLRITDKLSPLQKMFDKAIVAMPLAVKDTLRKKWFSETALTRPSEIPVVPYEHLQQLSSRPQALSKTERLELNGKDYFSFASVFTREQQPAEYFALVIPADRVYARSMQQLWLSVVIIAVVWILLMPIVLLVFIVRPFGKLIRKVYAR